MATILITGGTGMVGTRLTELLIEKGHSVIILTRNVPSTANETYPGIRYMQWDINEAVIDPEAISEADYIVHLAGAGVADKRWNKKRKEEIVSSRVKSSDLLVQAMHHTPNKIKAVISASGIGWYGADTGKSRKHGFMEDAPADTEFLGETCRLWEHHIAPVSKMGKRLAIFRIGIVLSNSGGALAEFKKPIKLGIATILGTGNQNISWIHIDDLCNLFIEAIENETMQGVYNAVAPETVTNKHLILALAKGMRGSFFIPFHIPAFLLKWILGEMSIEVLKSAKVNSFKIQSAGYHHAYPTLGKALKQLLHKL